MLNKTMNKRFIFFLCWITYVTAYLCRVNLSTALLKLESALGVTNGSLGIIGSLFFVTYAVGQLINGFIGDRVSPYKFLIIAATGTAALNAGISLTDNFYLIMLFWALNGYFQSMFWGPLMRILSEHYSKEDNANVSSTMTTSMITGFILSWVVLGRILVNASWIYYFLIPSIAALLISSIWMKISYKREDGKAIAQQGTLNFRELAQTFASEKLWLISVICVCLGLIKESVSLWAPIILTKALNIDVKRSFIFILIIPVTNLGGIYLARILVNRFVKKITNAILVLFSVVVASGMLLYLLRDMSPVIAVVMIALISAMTYGCNSILLSYIPLSFAHKNIVSTLVGIFDFSSYLGAALSSFVLGIILSSESWKAIPIIWVISSIAAMMLCKIAETKTHAVKKEEVYIG